MPAVQRARTRLVISKLFGRLQDIFVLIQLQNVFYPIIYSNIELNIYIQQMW